MGDLLQEYGGYMGAFVLYFIVVTLYVEGRGVI